MRVIRSSLVLCGSWGKTGLWCILSAAFAGLTGVGSTLMIYFRVVTGLSSALAFLLNTSFIFIYCYLYFVYLFINLFMSLPLFV